MSTVVPESYRPDIDGLRALAVLPVLLYHADVPGFSGGFIGVDIFFVISGYRITGIITREIDAGAFSILSFYERRARRILPALLTMIAFVLITASVLFLPSDLEGAAPSALAAIGFLSNVWLFTQTGYFQGPAEVTPLLHTWSWGGGAILYRAADPADRHRANAAWLADEDRAGVGIDQLCLGSGKQADTDGSAFYMLPTRAWEMLAGSLLAIGAVPTLSRRWAAEIVCALALIGIALGTALYDKQTVFPGVAAIVPVLAAASLIHCAPGTVAGRLLSMKGPVAIGLISYSLYRWHWPLSVFWRYSPGHDLTLAASAGLIGASVAIAWASGRFIEQPFRSKRRFDRRRILRWSAGGMGIAAAAALTLWVQGGWTSRFHPAALAFASGAVDVSPARADCIADRIADHPRSCNLGGAVPPSAPPSAIIWGDSHVVEIAWVLDEQYGARGQSIAQRTHGSCPPVIGYDPARDPRCALFNAAVMEEIAASPAITTVYLGGYWRQGIYRDARIDGMLDQTIAKLAAAGKQVVLFGPIRSQDNPVPRLLAFEGANARTAPTAAFRTNAQWFTRHYPAWRVRGVTIIEPVERLSRDGRSMIVAGGRPLYYDSHHLSLAGARQILAAVPAQ